MGDLAAANSKLAFPALIVAGEQDATTSVPASNPNFRTANDTFGEIYP